MNTLLLGAIFVSSMFFFLSRPKLFKFNFVLYSILIVVWLLNHTDIDLLTVSSLVLFISMSFPTLLALEKDFKNEVSEKKSPKKLMILLMSSIACLMGSVLILLEYKKTIFESLEESLPLLKTPLFVYVEQHATLLPLVVFGIIGIICALADITSRGRKNV